MDLLIRNIRSLCNTNKKTVICKQAVKCFNACHFILEQQGFRNKHNCQNFTHAKHFIDQVIKVISTEDLPTSVELELRKVKLTYVL